MVDTRIVGVLLFEDVEVLDFAGPFEVFGVAGYASGLRCADVFTVAQRRSPVLARNKLSVNPDYDFTDCPNLHILVVPGGLGTRRERENPALIAFIRRQHDRGAIILSVCTGALLLARAGLADGKAAVTHRLGMKSLEETAKDLRLFPSARIVDNGQIVFSAGVSAGIDAALYLIARLFDLETARATAAYMEYDWRFQAPDGEQVIDAAA